MVEVGQLAGRLRRGDDEAVDDAGYRHEAGEVGDGRHGDDADGESPPAPLRAAITRANPAAMASTASSQVAANDDVQLGVAGADERSGRVDRLHRAADEDVVEGLDGGEQGGEHAEVGERRRAAPRRRSGWLHGQRNSPATAEANSVRTNRDDEQLAQPAR